MSGYDLAYRIGFTPWERYGEVAAASIGAQFDAVAAERPLGRALDLGCGRGQYTVELVRRGWDAVGLDYVPRAIEAAKERPTTATFVVGDVTALDAGLGTFDFFLDAGCFQGLTAEQRGAEGRGVTALANEAATLLVLAFGPTRFRSLVGGVAQEDVEAAFSAWRLVSVEPAETAGLGWPLSRTDPHWYRFRLR